MSTEPPWKAACVAAVKEMGGRLCAESICQETVVNAYMHAYCTCQGQFRNGCAGPEPPPDCCQFSEASPVPIAAYECFCCCGEWSGPEAAQDIETARPMKEYATGEPIYVAVEISPQRWESRPVAWSGGTGPRAGMVRVAFADGESPRSLVVDGGQLFLAPGGSLRRAEELEVGSDELVAPDGTPRELISIQTGVIGEFHQVATTTTPATTPEGHLIVLDGVV